MRTGIAIVLTLVWALCQAQEAPAGGSADAAAYPETEARAAWGALSASYVRKALKDRKLNQEPALNGRVDAVMARIGATLARLDPRFAEARWKAILIEDFGYGAVAFPGETIIVDARFVRRLDLGDDELALIFAHEVAHVVAGHAYAKLAFMARVLGKDRAPTARSALLEFLAVDSYAEAFQPVALLQEREADRIGAGILLASGYDTRRALSLFDKLEAGETGQAQDSHDAAATRKRLVMAVLAELRACAAGKGGEAAAALQAAAAPPPRCEAAGRNGAG